MISIHRESGYLIISRAEFLYRDGRSDADKDSEAAMGDGDILIPLPAHMISKEWDNKSIAGRINGSDGQSAQIIIDEIRRRLGCD